MEGQLLMPYLMAKVVISCATNYKRMYPKKFDSYFKFSFVRNPWDKMVSFYHYHKKRRWDLNWDWNKNNAPNFQDFIRIINNYSKEQECAIFPNFKSSGR